MKYSLSAKIPTLGLLAFCLPLLGAFDCNHNPQARISQAAVEFGAVPMGGTFRFPILIDFDVSRGQDLTVLQITGGDADEFEVDAAITTGPLNEDGWLYIPVTFRPKRATPAHAVLSMTVQFDGGDHLSNLHADLYANSGGPSPVEVTFAPSVITSPLYQSSTYSVEMKVTRALTQGKSPAIEQVTLEGDSSFDYQGAGATGSVMFPISDVLSGTLSFGPSSAGTKHAMLRVNMGPHSPDLREDARAIGRVLEIPLEGITRVMELTPSPLLLNIDPAGGAAQGTMTLKNLTLVPSQVTGIDLSPVDGVDLPFAAQAAASALPGNGSMAVQVQFVPSGLPSGTYKAKIVIHTSNLGDVEGLLEGTL